MGIESNSLTEEQIRQEKLEKFVDKYAESELEAELIRNNYYNHRKVDERYVEVFTTFRRRLINYCRLTGISMDQDF